jgi:hypothetical protein
MTRDKVDLFEMANLSPALTGLPMVVWVSERRRARHDVRIKVHMAHGRQMSVSNTATVAVRPTMGSLRHSHNFSRGLNGLCKYRDGAAQALPLDGGGLGWG